VHNFVLYRVPGITPRIFAGDNKVCMSCNSPIIRSNADPRRPVDISIFLQERSLPIEFISRLLASTLKAMNEPLGKLKGTTYTPRIYDEERENALIERLQKKNIIGILL